MVCLFARMIDGCCSAVVCFVLFACLFLSLLLSLYDLTNACFSLENFSHENSSSRLGQKSTRGMGSSDRQRHDTLQALIGSPEIGK